MDATPLRVALLRGINVGGKHRLPMKALIGLFEELGCRDVRSYIQSGNVLFRSTPRVAKTLPARLPGLIRRDFGFEAPVVIRAVSEIVRAAARHPFVEGANPAHLAIAFLSSRPGRAAIARLDPNRSPPDRFEVAGGEIYLHLPNGAARTKLTNAYFDSRLETISTARNWQTVQKLIELGAD